MIILKVQKSSPDPPFDTPSLLSRQQNQLKPLLKPMGKYSAPLLGVSLRRKLLLLPTRPPTQC